MGKGRPRAVEKGVLGHNCAGPSSAAVAGGGFPVLPQAPVFHPTEEEFQDPLEFISKIRPHAEPFGICRIVPPKSWNPPFALELQSFTFPTKSQAIHRLLARPASCDPRTFELEYGRFLEGHLGRKPKRRAVFEGEELDLCHLFNAVKRYGSYDKVCREKLWGEVARFVLPGTRISECSKHVLCQLYREHLYDYEEYHRRPDHGTEGSKRDGASQEFKTSGRPVGPDRKRSRKNSSVESVKEVSGNDQDQICEQCKSGLHGEVMLLCDRCDKGWHLYCLSPPLESVPSGNWYCLDCVNSDKDTFGFVPGKRCSLEAFRRRDDRAKRKWLGQSHTTRSQIEKRFWEIVEGRAGEVEVKYGSDLDTSMYGSGFPRADDTILSSVKPEVWKEYSSSPWNLNNLPKLQGSMLRVVHDNIAGVMVPWLYVGMLFSSFCWHVEDHCFYSINYLHWGEPKCWYGVPGTAANAFEKVMRSTLPDLFDAQPDLLFQLVTMLSPSVLQENGVPVYGVLQEPGNFVITFPRSFHGGFNFGLNCAEAVNFATADWLPHGGFGAELYRLYHKAAVLSHEELLCVVAKNGCDAKVLSYLNEEMHRIFVREKKCREELWRNGAVRSSLMPPKKQPMYVGTEEDPTCVICQQYLYLSAITCSCRPSAFVCLEHWKHLCECSPNKRHLLYRHTLAELDDLVCTGSPLSGAICNVPSPRSRNSRWRQLLSHESSAMTKKVKGHNFTYEQLAEDWLSKSCHIFEISFSVSSYKRALQEAEQFLWADHNMDPVRDMVKRLIEALKWGMSVRHCLSKLDYRFRSQNTPVEKVSLCEVEELLNYDPLPCYEPGHAKLKAYAKDAKLLTAEMESALSSRLDIGELERLYSRAIEFPVNLEETGILAREISSAKVLMNNAREYLSGKNPSAIDIDILNKLKLEMLELRVQLPEMDMVLNLCREVELWQVQCKEILTGPLKMKELEDFLREADNATVSIPELKLLRQCLCDARSWISHVHDILKNIKNREDHENIVAELYCILRDGDLLRVQVEELPLVEAELKRSLCREKALKALAIQMPLELIEQLEIEASLLEIENENLFMNISKVRRAATSWEERAKFVLGHAAQLSEFEDLVRTSENISVILPSLPDVKDAISVAQSWISRSQSYLLSSKLEGDVFCPLRKVDDLKELVVQSKLLKVTLDGFPDRLESILKDVDEWEHNAHSLLECLNSLLYMQEADLVFDNQLSINIKELLKRIDSATEIGLSLGFELNQLPKLQHASLTLQWCLKALSFSSRIPLLKEVDSLFEDADHFPPSFCGNNFTQVLIKGSSWLRKAFIIFELQSSKRCKLKDVEQILGEIQKITVPYPEMVGRLRNAIEKHESWIERMRAFFRLPGEQSWSLLVKLKEHGQSDAFDCPELHKVAFKIEKVEKWMLQCHAVVEPLVGDLGSLFTELVKIKGTMERALCIYRGSRGYRTSTFCVCCPNDSENEQVYTCLTCEDRYHFSCMGPPLATAGMTHEYACPFCLCMESGAISRNGGHALICRENRPELKSFIELLSNSEDLCADIEERALVQEIIIQALECRKYLTQIVNHTFSLHGKDLNPISENLLCALKAIAVAGVYDHQDGCKLEAAWSRNAWKIRVMKLLRGSKKPAIQQVQQLLKEGLAIGIPSEDYFMQEITKVKQISLQWAATAKKVASDSGALELSEVFKLIIEGETLPVEFEKEMKLLRERSVLYCICRKPYDQRAMIACDQCDEWYHFDCIDLNGPPPKIFFCPACKPLNGEFISLPRPTYIEERLNTDEEPHTPPACHDESKVRCSKRVRSSLHQKMESAVDLGNILRCYSEIDHLWRENRRPLQRTGRKRSEFESLSRIFHI